MNTYKSGYIGNELLWLKFFYSFIQNCSNSERFIEQYEAFHNDKFSVMQRRVKAEIERLINSKQVSENKLIEIKNFENKFGYFLPNSMKDFYLSGCLEIYNSIITYSSTSDLLEIKAINYCIQEYPELTNAIKEDYDITKRNFSEDNTKVNNKYFTPSNYLSSFPNYELLAFFPLEIKKHYNELLLISASNYIEFVTLMLPYEQTIDNEMAIWLYETGLEFKHYPSFAEYIVVELIAEALVNGDEVNISDLKSFNADYIIDLDIISNR